MNKLYAIWLQKNRPFAIKLSESSPAQTGGGDGAS